MTELSINMKCVILVLICSLHQFKITQCGTASSEEGSFEYESVQPVFESYINFMKKNKNEKEPQFLHSARKPRYEAEKAAGSMADLFGANQHYSYPSEYTDFGRRFGKQYSNSKNNNILRFGMNNELVPEKASPEMVLAVAKESAILEASKPINPTDDIIKKEILRTGDYWNAVWKEDIDPKTLRTYKKHKPLNSVEQYSQPKLESVKTRFMPGTKLYQLVAALKKISPRLLYVINEKRE